MVGATGSMMDVVNVKIYKDMRNKINRVTNCETSNIEKTVSAATTQAADIRYLKKMGVFQNLEVVLKETGEARRCHPEMSLGSWESFWECPVRESIIVCKNQQIAKQVREEQE